MLMHRYISRYYRGIKAICDRPVLMFWRYAKLSRRERFPFSHSTQTALSSIPYAHSI